MSQDQYNKAKIDNTEENCKYRFFGNRDERIDHIIREYNKPTFKKYKTRHD